MKKQGQSFDYFQGLDGGFGVSLNPLTPTPLAVRVYTSLSKIPEAIVRGCGVTSLSFRDMGVSLEYSPNHGLYVDGTVVLNTQLIDDPIVFTCNNGGVLDRFDHTLYHEFGHGWDEVRGNLSLQDEWLSLSGWSKESVPGKVRVNIFDKDSGETLVGEWCYTPGSEFTRPYARWNPWDDFADTFAFYVAGLHDFVPKSKGEYFKKHLEA